MSNNSISTRLRGLEERLESERRGSAGGGGTGGPTAPAPAPRAPPSLSVPRPGMDRRPRPPAIFTAAELPVFPPRAPHAVETENRMLEVYKDSGKLIVDGNNYFSEIDQLDQLGELGSGTCGHVVKMLHKPSKAVIAVKQMRRSSNSEETKRILMDLHVVMHSHDCPYIVHCYGYFVTDADVWICMELMASCFDKLLKRLKAPVPEEILGKVTVATVNALSYLKEKHLVIHRDVKPSNILLDERGNVKLCDFGISGRLVDSKAKTRSAGCAAYMAPERIDPPDPNRPDYDIRADVWSLGISLVELATGVFPYRDCQNDFEVLTRVINEEAPTLPDTADFSPEFKIFVEQCLMKNYKERPKYATLLKHPFVVKSARSNVSVAAWYASIPGSGSPTVPARPSRPVNTVSTFATHTVGPLTNDNTRKINYSQHPIPNGSRTYELNGSRSINYVQHEIKPRSPRPNVRQSVSPRPPVTKCSSHLTQCSPQPTQCSPKVTQCPLQVTQCSPQTTPPQSIVSSITAQVNSPRLFDRLNSQPRVTRDENTTPTPSRAWWASPSGVFGGSSSQPASLEAELGNYSPYPLRRALETSASPPPPPPPARRVSADSRWRPSPAGSGNTSPIVLQRFYHQSQQRRSRADLHSTPRHRSLSREHSTGRSPEPPPRSGRQMLGLDTTAVNLQAANGSCGDSEREPPPLHERLRPHSPLHPLHDRSTEGRSQSLTRAELRNGWRQEHPAPPPPLSPHSPHPPTKHHHDDQGWLHSLAGLVKRRLTNYVKWHHVVGSQPPLQPSRQLSRAPRWGGAESWSVPASPLPPRAPPPRPAD